MGCCGYSSKKKEIYEIKKPLINNIFKMGIQAVVVVETKNVLDDRNEPKDEKDNTIKLKPLRTSNLLTIEGEKGVSDMIDEIILDLEYSHKMPCASSIEKKISINSETSKNKREKKVSNKSVRNTTMNKRNELNLDLKSVEDYLKEDINDSNDKLRKALTYLKERTEIDIKKWDSSQFRNLFLEPIESHFKKLYLIFEEENNQGYRPTIKMLQVFDLMLEKLTDREKEKSWEQVYFSIEELIKQKADWRTYRKLHDQKKKYLFEGVFLSINNEPSTGFMIRLGIIKNAIVWKKQSKSKELVEKILKILESKSREDPNKFLQSLILGRFDKNNENLSGSLIVGDEGGLYYLMNSVSEDSLEEDIIIQSGITREFLKEIRNKNNNKVVLGEGNFGKVRIALSIFGDENVDIGQLVCVKKSKKTISNNENFSEITQLVFDDFLTKKLNQNIYAPMKLDMAIISNTLNEEKHRKSYFSMEIVPQHTADKVFSIPEYQKWEFQKPYCEAIISNMLSLLEEEKILNTDLKPKNTLFDVSSRKMSIIDFGSSIFFENEKDIKKYDQSLGEFSFTKLYCPPEFKGENKAKYVDCRKVLSYLCGATIAQITSITQFSPEDKITSIEKWEIAEKTDLPEKEKKELLWLIKNMLMKDPEKRLNLGDTLQSLKIIGTDRDINLASSIHYIERVKFLIKNEPTTLDLNSDINLSKEKGIIEQFVGENNPRLVKFQKIEHLEKEMLNFLESNEEPRVVVLFGDAGSGKSLAIQLLFIKEVENWSPGNPLPIYFNMAAEIYLPKVINRINSNISCNLQLENKENEQFHIFIDSYDEGPWNQEEFNKKISNSSNNVIEEYFEFLKGEVKVVITCRTDFAFFNNNEDLLNSPFTVRGSLPRTFFIMPLDYENDVIFPKNMSKQSGKFVNLIKNWLSKEKLEYQNERNLFNLIKNWKNQE